ncbi:MULTISPECIES: peptide ABC transporter substrate-binding protein [Cysteiniphilum]|uniref:peptide ABC transporter substrate-binding protein n=1 Tax=Cysteiniphilum TaxID=2056696 RepID=UPI001783B0EA|nr:MULTISPECIES: peptide ABC transporter substrate-binding protein [Cysteiniphilum]
MKGSKKILVLGLTLALAALSGCGGNSTQTTDSDRAPKGKDTLIVGVGTGVPTLDPQLVNDTTSGRVVDDLFEGLTTENQSNKAVPGVAKSWDISKDGTVYTFHLRDNAKWSNGKPVTAEDFVFSLRRAVTPETAAPNNTMLNVIKGAQAIMDNKAKADTLGVKALDDSTLQITLAHPLAYFPAILANPVAYPVYPPLVKEDPKGWAQAGKMISNGAYELKEWIPNGHILALKNPNYWDASNVKIDKVRYLPINNPTDELNRYKAGQMDITWTLPDGLSADQYRQQFGSQFVDVTQLGAYYYWFNTNAKGVDKLEVRKALTMTVNRKAIIDAILKMGQTPLYSIVPQGIQGGIYDNVYKDVPSYSWVNKPMAERDQIAKGLLEKAGYSDTNPLNLTISYNTLPTHQKIAEAITQMWKQAFGGMVSVKVQNEEWKVYLQTLQQQNYQIGRFAWIADFNAASNFVDMFLCNSPNNNAGFCNKALDKEYQLGMYAPTQAQFDSHMKKAIEIAMAGYYSLPLYNYTYYRLVKPYIGGYDPENNHMDHVYSKWMYFKK